MKRLLYLSCLLFVMLGVLHAEDKEAVITATETEYDFGEIKEVDGPVVHTFVIKNSGTGTLVITRVIPSCGCTTPEYSPEPIKPNAERKILIRFNPAGRKGPFMKRITIYSNGKQGGFTLFIKGNVE